MTAPASKTDRVLSALLRPFAKVEAAEAITASVLVVLVGREHKKRSGELEQLAAQGIGSELGAALP